MTLENDVIEVRIKAHTRREVMETAELIKSKFPGAWSSRLLESNSQDGFLIYLHVVLPRETLDGTGC